MHTIAVRDVQPGEVEAVAALQEAAATVAYAHIFPPDAPYPREDTLRRWRTFTGRILVAEAAAGGPLAGFAAFDERELHALYVAPEYWSQGVGAQLLAAAGPVQELWVLQENWRARRFYERHGWHPDGAEREAYGVVEVRYRRAEAAILAGFGSVTPSRHPEDFRAVRGAVERAIGEDVAGETARQQCPLTSEL